MSKLKVFCFGFGQVAKSFVKKLIYEKKDLDLNVTSRKETHHIEFNNLKSTSYHFNNDKHDVSIKKKIRGVRLYINFYSTNQRQRHSS